MSGFRQLSFGVSQGSNLGPLLFIIYVNDLLYELPNGAAMYADDTVACNAALSVDEAMKLTQLATNQVVDWCDMNHMTINVSKTKHMLFDSARKCRLTDEAILINGKKDNVKNYITIWEFLWIAS